MKRYEQYNQVNLPWLKEVPSHWKVEKLKKLVNFKTGSTPSGKIGIESQGAYPWITAKDFNDNGYFNSYSEYINENLVTKGYIFPKNSVLIICIASIGKVGLLECDGYSNQQITALTNIKSNHKFIMYFMMFYSKIILKNEVNSNVVGIINTTRLKNILLTLPPLEEQTQIAKFLDWKIAEIDRLIEFEKSKIEKLEELFITYIRSQIDNKSRNVKLKIVSTIIPGKEIKKEVDYKYSKKVSVYGSSEKPFKYTDEYLLSGNYIIFGRKGTLGKPYKISGDFWIVDTAYAIKNNKNIEYNFLYYTLKVFPWDNYITKTAKPSIVANEIKEQKIFCPSIETQKSIIQNIENFDFNIEKIKNLTINQITYLKELKQTLISDAVTGKIDVRDINIPKNKV